MKCYRARTGCFRIVATTIGAVVLAVLTSTSMAGEQAARQPTVWQDDANLHDITFVGSRAGWAVGDRGVVWHTQDAGETWSFVRVPEDCSLRSVCFLTHRVGWVAGAVVKPVVGPRGVLFFTDDGGITWIPLHEASGTEPEHQPLQALSDKNTGGRPPTASRKTTLPPLQSIQFLDRENGYAAGRPVSGFASGVLQTSDGGSSWEAVPGTPSGSWRAAAFLQPAETSAAMGVVVGDSGMTALVGGNRLLESTFASGGTRALYDVALSSDDSGWLVGDGSLVQRTDTGGVVWTEPPGLLPVELRNFVDFRSVATFGSHVWIAGDPGSVIWHSSDGGATWNTQKTGHTLPIRRLRFTSGTAGIAVGDFGCILKTNDGGTTWTPIRGSDRRAAFVAFCPRAERIPLHLVTRYSGERGYRGYVSFPTRRTSAGRRSDPQSTIAAVLAAGANRAQVDWRFPIDIPDIERSRGPLIERWNRRLEGRMAPVLLGRLVSQLRTLRPDVVIIDAEAPDDAAATLLNEAVRRAIIAAGDLSQFTEHGLLAGLKPWRVRRTVQRQPDGSAGPIQIDPFEYLPESGQANHVITSTAGRMISSTNYHTVVESFRAIEILDDERPDHDLFSGLNISHRSAARRSRRPIDETLLEDGMKLAERQRTIRNWADKSFGDSRVAASSLAELNDITAGMTPAQAALQLDAIATELKQHWQWTLAAETLSELVARFPDQPTAAEAMQWLLWWHGSAENVWQTHQGLATSAKGADGTRIVQANATVGGQEGLSREVEASFNRAARSAAEMREHWPSLFHDPQTQLTLASLLRKRNSAGGARGIYSQLIQPGSPWSAVARGEFWLLAPTGEPPVKVALCRRAAQRPQLDAVLSEPMWQDSAAIRLAGENSDDSPGLVMMARDQQFLYIAGTFARHPAVRKDGPRLDGRTHDESLVDFDRVTFRLDTDRDYATWYTLAIDQRGCTNDRCFGDVSWNPKWFVAADGDTQRWRFEAAIAFSEFGPTVPAPQTVWAMGLSRTIPAVAAESWTQPPTTEPSPETFGFVRFE